MSKKISILVIHGIGEQDPFETLDAFVRPFARVYSSIIHSASISKKHLLMPFPDWVESCVSLDPNVPNRPIIDIYEYYWAHMTQREITADEVVEWGMSVAEGAKEFYKRQKDMKGRAKNDKLFTCDGEFRYLKYLMNLLSFGNRLRYLGLLLAQLFKFVGPAFKFVRPVMKWIRQIFKGPLVDVLGDVALYTTTDKRSKYFKVRKKILDESVKKVTHILKDMDYKEVILAGHSLGSVIAYDTLDRLNKAMAVDAELRKHASKIKGLVTFGSPLDKIAFFFDDKINKEKQDIRYAIVSQLHGFKRINVDTLDLENGVGNCFEHVKWLNFWTKPDPVCGHLDVYKDVENIELDFSEKNKYPKCLKWLTSKISVNSHSLYWQSDEMYERIVREFKLG